MAIVTRWFKRVGHIDTNVIATMIVEWSDKYDDEVMLEFTPIKEVDDVFKFNKRRMLIWFTKDEAKMLLKELHRYFNVKGY